MTPDSINPDATRVDAVNAEASALMKRGIGIMEGAQPDIGEALVCFDRALELRQGLPYRSNPVLGYGLAACWLNRADALSQTFPPQVDEALRSYDEGIALLRELPLEDDALFPRRLAIAHQNRGLILQSRGADAIAEVLEAFSDALGVLDREFSHAIPDRQHLLAAVWMNLANARASQDTAESGVLAREAALQSIALVADLETNDAGAAHIGLRARHVLCRMLAEHLSLVEPDDPTIGAAVHEATDAVDDGLDLVRSWERRGETRFRDLACDLFRFGVRVYGQYQPRFVEEFILDNVDPAQSSTDYVNSPQMRWAVEEGRALVARAAGGSEAR